MLKAAVKPFKVTRLCSNFYFFKKKKEIKKTATQKLFDLKKKINEFDSFDVSWSQILILIKTFEYFDQKMFNPIYDEIVIYWDMVF